ncbi:ABC transporter permease [Nocardioides jishulii]|uniref:ABC transporter permease n=1 Tax=Nocardioides jishulii TaxID=2575440 RepID=A0A4U2YTE0_9ACTN|nr:ABC transporter permease [Nocardioides jishulii]QCX28647.1 ABC transporter permease [Nocardioides jishulii]TKI64460.1 ABC transporter permease [Nocardioides jishulii]
MSTTTSLTRTTGLARFNLVLMARNRTTLIYGFAMPLIPLLLLFAMPDTTPEAGVGALTITLVMALIFPGYYNLLSMFVTRRDELVLKRLRTGEIRDGELLTSMALPGAAITLGVMVLAVPIAAVAGFDLPRNPLLLLAATLVACVTFAALAVWTASWTRTAESAQLTSGPVMIIALAGSFTAGLPEAVTRWTDLLPGAAISDLMMVAWFGRDPDGLDRVGWLQGFVEAGPALGLLVVWAVVALVMAMRALRWEPRA